LNAVRQIIAVSDWANVQHAQHPPYHGIVATRVHGRGDADERGVLDEEERRDRLLEELGRDSAAGGFGVKGELVFAGYKTQGEHPPRRFLEDEALPAGALRSLRRGSP